MPRAHPLRRRHATRTDHLARLREELDRWAGWVGDGMSEEEFVRRTRESAGADAEVHDVTDLLGQSWQGLRRYWDKRREAEVSDQPSSLS